MGARAHENEDDGDTKYDGVWAHEPDYEDDGKYVTTGGKAQTMHKHIRVSDTKEDRHDIRGGRREGTDMGRRHGLGGRHRHSDGRKEWVTQKIRCACDSIAGDVEIIRGCVNVRREVACVDGVPTNEGVRETGGVSTMSVEEWWDK